MSAPVALVTGASRGIGRACALALAQKGFDLVVWTNSSDPAPVCKEIVALGRQALGAQGDIADLAVHARVLDRVRTHYGRMDVLVNNAGVAPKVRADVLEATAESYDFVMQTNLRGPYFLTQQVARWMLEQRRACADRRMAIVNISSISAYTASLGRAEYCVSKAGISMMTQVYAARLAGEGVGVYEIRPGIVQTDMTKTVQAKYDALLAGGLTPIRKWVQPEDVAQAVALCATGALPMTAGQVLDVDGGFHLRVL